VQKSLDRHRNLIRAEDFDAGAHFNVSAVSALSVVAADEAADHISGHQAAVG
jgi:hypothetical protein